MADNLDPVADNQDQPTTEEPVTEAPVTAEVPAKEETSFSWKGKVGADLSKAPSLGKFEDTQDGLAEVAKSYVNLEKLLGHDKVPLPKGPEDLEGRAQFNRAIGVPAVATEYNLPDAELPEALADVSFNKEAFQDIVHKHHLTPDQAQGLWKAYTDMSGNVFQSHMTAHEDLVNKNANALRAEWGDSFAAKVELGDMVITKFAGNQEDADFLMATLSKEPAGMKFLAKIGQQFSENRVGEFHYQRHGLSPEEAGDEITKIKADPNHAYNNLKATDKDHDAAVAHVNRLIAMTMGKPS